MIEWEGGFGGLQRNEWNKSFFREILKAVFLRGQHPTLPADSWPLAPWQVSEVNINEINGEVVVRVTHTGKGLLVRVAKLPGRFTTTPLRRWRHLDTCQMATVIECSIPRIRCENTAYSGSGTVGWSEIALHVAV
ncbi:MAG: transposase family protein [Fibrobacteres bacterium]|nr:transposase family protein [Fibrobacterota bacterium]